MKPAKFKKYLLSLFLVNLFLFNANLALAAASTEYTGVQASIEQYLCHPTDASKDISNTSQAGLAPDTAAQNNSAQNDLYKCINTLYKFAIAIGSSAGVLMLVIAGYLYISSDGNQEAVDKAKGMLISTLTAMVILFSGYVLLRTLNPDLIAFQNIQPPSVVLDKMAAPGTGTVTGSVSTLAQTINSLNGSKLTINSTRCDCSNNCPSNALQALANGQPAQKDGPGSTCNAGTTNVSTAMLGALVTAANAGNKFIIESLTGGHHANSSAHYRGQAVDVIPQPANGNTQAQLVSSLRQSGASEIALECNGGYTSLTGSNDGSTACIGQSGYHIHAQW